MMKSIQFSIVCVYVSTSNSFEYALHVIQTVLTCAFALICTYKQSGSRSNDRCTETGVANK